MGRVISKGWGVLAAAVVALLAAAVWAPAASAAAPELRAARALLDPSRELGLAQVRAADAAGNFAPAAEVLAHSGPSRAAHWLALELAPAAQPEPWVLLVPGHAELARICVYWPRRGGRDSRNCGGLDAWPDSAWDGGYRFAAPGDIDWQRPVYLQAWSESWMRLPVALHARDALDRRQRAQSFAWGAYYGGMAILGLSALLAWIYLRLAVFALFALHLGTATLAFLCWQGWPLSQQWWQAPWWATHAPPLLLSLFVASGVLFYGRYLRLQASLPRLHRAYTLLGLLALANAVLALLLPGWAYQALGLLAPLFCSLTLLFAIVGSLRGDAAALQVVAAMGLLLAGAALKGLEAFGLTPLEPSRVSDLLRLGVALGGVAMAFGLGQHARGLRAERDEAREMAEASQALARRLADRDELSGLLVRRAFLEQVDRHDPPLDLVVVLHLGGTYDYERLYGATALGLLFKHYAERLVEWVEEPAVLGRAGPLSFTLAVPAGRMSERALEDLRQRSERVLYANSSELSLRIGVARLARAGGSAALRQAEKAVWRDVGDRPPRLEPGTPVVGEQAAEWVVDNPDLCLHYQPIVPMQLGAPMNCEVLLRLQRRGELLYPGQFMYQLTDPQRMRTMTDQLLDGVCRQFSAWRKQGLPLGRVAVNLFSADLDDAQLVPRLLDPLRRYGLKPAQISLEVPETTLVRHLAIAQSTFDALRAEGFRIAVDDFGAGYTSVAWLRQLPVDVVKLDKSLIDDLPRSPEACAVVDTLLGLAGKLRIAATAEGVETPAQLKYLREQGCHYVQGYLMSRPLDAEAFAAWVRDKHRQIRPAGPAPR